MVGFTLGLKISCAHVRKSPLRTCNVRRIFDLCAGIFLPHIQCVENLWFMCGNIYISISPPPPSILPVKILNILRSVSLFSVIFRFVLGISFRSGSLTSLVGSCFARGSSFAHGFSLRSWGLASLMESRFPRGVSLCLWGLAWFMESCYARVVSLNSWSLVSLVGSRFAREISLPLRGLASLVDSHFAHGVLLRS